jgi:hypothetical protein
MSEATSECICGHFFAPSGARMEVSYVRSPRPNGEWAYYKVPGSERVCECADAASAAAGR